MLMKIKPIPPSMREKKRYVATEIISEGNLNMAKKTIKSNYSHLFGTTGLAKAGLMFLKDSTAEPKRVLIRVSTKSLDQLKASFNFIKKVGDKPAIVRSVGVSGSLKKVREKYFAK